MKNHQFVERLQIAMGDPKEGGFTNRSLADIMGIHADLISKWKTGRSHPSFKHMGPLANALGVSLDWLFSGAEVGAAKEQ